MTSLGRVKRDQISRDGSDGPVIPMRGDSRFGPHTEQQRQRARDFHRGANVLPPSS